MLKCTKITPNDNQRTFHYVIYGVPNH